MYRDRVWQTSTSTGTGNFTLGAAATGHRTFSTAFGTAAAYYVIVNQADPTQWEVGSYTVNANTLARTAGNVLAGSSGSGVLVNFGAGTKDVFNAPPATIMARYPRAVGHSGTAQGSSRPITAGHRIALELDGNGNLNLHTWNPNCVNCDCYS